MSSSRNAAGENSLSAGFFSRSWPAIDTGPTTSVTGGSSTVASMRSSCMSSGATFCTNASGCSGAFHTPVRVAFVSVTSPGDVFG